MFAVILLTINWVIKIVFGLGHTLVISVIG